MRIVYRVSLHPRGVRAKEGCSTEQSALVSVLKFSRVRSRSVSPGSLSLCRWCVHVCLTEVAIGLCGAILAQTWSVAVAAFPAENDPPGNRSCAW